MVSILIVTEWPFEHISKSKSSFWGGKFQSLLWRNGLSNFLIGVCQLVKQQFQSLLWWRVRPFGYSSNIYEISLNRNHDQGFNPYYPGSTLRTLNNWLREANLNIPFQSLLYWNCPSNWKANTHTLDIWHCFNPYYPGSTLRTIIRSGTKRQKIRVSILIILEVPFELWYCGSVLYERA